MSRRETANDDWGEPENLGSPINTGQGDSDTSISSDGLEMYFTAYQRPGGHGDSDIWVTRRVTRNDPWAQPENLGSGINTSGYEHYPRISPDGLELYFSSSRVGGYGVEDLWVSRRVTKNDPWAEPVNLGPTVNSSASEDFPSLSPDGLLLFFSENRDSGPLQPGGYGGPDLWAARRASVSDPWGTPVNFGLTVNSSSLECAATLSPDGHTLYFTSERSGGLGGPYGDIHQAPILPIVDFHGDGKVAIDDLVLLIDNWDQNEPLCDIGPMPWGDGIVDRQDLEVLMSHWGQEVQDGTFLVHWKLDETEGTVASDSAGDHDGTVIGAPVWQPAGGQIGGAMQFDGATLIAADTVLNPSDGPFSVLAWVKGGAPGQAILSQQASVNWLQCDPATGALMTELSSGGRSATILYSDAFITDGAWYRVGFTWDGTNRRLYVDDVLVAEDMQDGLAACYAGLSIGCGKTMAPSTFWSGLIDDIRIYNRAVRP